MLRQFIRSQERLSRGFDKLLPEKFSIDGNSHFVNELAPQYVEPGMTVYDIGGGKNPFLSAERKAELGLRVVGLDIDAGELARAPAGAYDATVCADITQYVGQGDADLVICQSLMEHVADTDATLRAMASILKPGGRALIFVPSRNAIFARINLLLPETLKRRILFTIYPQTERDQGFPAYYDHCTPAALRARALGHGLSVEGARFYYISSYFQFFFPLYLAWRAWLLAFHSIDKEQAAETFSLVLSKGPANSTTLRQ